MAEQTGLRNNALPYPIYGVPFGVTFPLLDADGDPISPSSPDSERSLNGDTFADCTNEATEIATSSGICYLLLTAAEMTADVVTVQVKSTGAKTTVLTFYPRKLVTLRTGTVGANAADGTTLQLDASASAVDDSYNGCVLVAVIDSVTEARIIGDYVGSTKVCTVAGPAFNTAPDNNDTFTVYLVEGTRQVNVVDWRGQGLPQTLISGYPLVDTAVWLGTSVATPTVAGVPEVDVTHVDGVAGGGAEMADAVWDEARSGHVAAGSFGQATQTISGTATAGGASTITLAVGSSASDDFYNGLLICIVGGTGEGQNKFIADYTGATRVATVSGTWVTQPDNTSVYAIVGV